jgi:hypothetical protein
VRWARHVAHIGEKRYVYRGWVGKPEGSRPLEIPKCNVRIILKWILEKYDRRVLSGFIWLWTGISSRLL